MSDELYCYPPDYRVLKNRLDIRDGDVLAAAEAEFVRTRIEQGSPSGQFDLNHLRDIHHHLFQDVYEWAGEVRQVEISKGGHQFPPKRFIEAGMADVHRRLVEQKYFTGAHKEIFVQDVGGIIGDVNYVHPFREGNGRTQLQYLKQLGDRAGFAVDISKLDPDEWINASIRSHAGDYDGMRLCLAAITTERAGRGRGVQQPLSKDRER